MSRWTHLFSGEFAKRDRIFAGLTLEQVSSRPSPPSHTIYEELWHLVLWQRILVTRDETLYEETWQKGERYPREAPRSLAAWTALVEDYSAGVARALDWAATPENLSLEVDPGVTMADVLQGLAVHNAYHFGKIVALRQMMNAWPT